MQRFKWLVLLCAFVVLWSSPGWAGTTHNVTVSENKIKIGETEVTSWSELLNGNTIADGDTIQFGEGEFTIQNAIKLTTSKSITIKGSGKNTKLTTNVTDVIEVSKGTLILGENFNLEGSSSLIWTHGDDNAKIVIAGANLTCKSGNYSAAFAEGTSAIDMTSGSFMHTGSANHVTLSISGAKATSTISGGIISNDQSSTLVATQGTIIINGGEIYTSSTSSVIAQNVGYCAAYSKSGGKIIMNGGTVGSQPKMGAAANGVLIATGNSSVEVNGGTIVAPNGWHAVLAHESNSKAIITGGTLTGYVGAGDGATSGSGDSMNTLTISGGEITGSVLVGWTNKKTFNNTVIISGNAKITGSIYAGYVSSDQTTIMSASNDVQITGGTIEGSVIARKNSTAKISGGTFKTKPNDDYLIEGFVAVLKDSVYNVLKAVKLTSPTLGAITYGNALSTIALTTGGTAKAIKSSADTASVDVAGTFAWQDGAITPAVSDSKNTKYKIVFTPTDTNTYETTSIDVTVTVNKAASSVTTAPAQAAASLTYNGQAQNLVTAGVASGGTMYYATDGTTFSSSIPTGTDAQSYTVSYKVSGDANHNDTEAGTVAVTISPAKADATVTANSLTYNGSEQELVTAGTVTGGTLQYAVGETAGEYSTNIPKGTNAGSYTVWYKVNADSNYSNLDPKSLIVTIASVDISSATVSLDKTTAEYTGSQQSVTISSVKVGDLTLTASDYDVTGGLTGTNAGEYTVTVTAKGNFTGTKTAVWTISKADISSSLKTEPGTPATTSSATGTKTSKTTTFTLGSGTSASAMSVDVAITTPEKFEAQVDGNFSAVISVDTILNSNKEFKNYAYSMDISGLPAWVTKTGTLTSSDANADSKGTYHHEFTLSGTPTEILENGSITFTAWITLSSDNYSGILTASVDKKVSFDVKEGTVVNPTVLEAKLAWSATSFTYTGEAQAPTATVSNLLEGDVCAVTVTVSGDKATDGKAVNAGSYTATATALGNANYKLPENASTAFTIAKADIKPSVTIADWAHGATASTPVISGNTGNGTVTYLYKSQSGTTAYESATAPTSAGSYTLTITIAETDNYNSGTAEASFKITGGTGETEKTPEELVEEAVNEDGTINDDVMTQLIENVATETEGELTPDDIAKNTAVVNVLANSVSNTNNTTNELNLSSIALTSTKGIAALLTAVQTGSGVNTSEMTLILSKNSDLSQVSDLSGVEVKSLNLEGNTSVKTVDLKGATITGTLNMKGMGGTKGATETKATVDLKNAKVDTVDMSDSAVGTLTLDPSSDVKTIQASGSDLADINLAGNENIESLDISETEVTKLDAAGCAGLTNLTAAGSSNGTGKLKKIDISGCSSLTELTVSRNQLFGIKGHGLTSVRTFKARGQKVSNPSASTVFRRSMNFWEFLWNLWRAIVIDDIANGNTDETDPGEYVEGTSSKDIAPFDVEDIASVYDPNNTSNDATPDADGMINFTTTPNGIKYDYVPDFPNAGLAGFITAADEDSENGMDVEVSDGTTEEEATLGNSSGGGCDAGFGLGALSALMLVFATLKKRR